MQFNLSDKEKIRSYVYSKIIKGDFETIRLSIFISSGFVYDIIFHIGPYIITQINDKGMDCVFDIIYKSISKKICKCIEGELHLNNFHMN